MSELLNPGEQQRVAKRLATPEGRMFVRQMKQLLGKTDLEAKRALLNPHGWAGVLKAANDAVRAKRKAERHRLQIAARVWVPESPIVIAWRVRNPEKEALLELAVRHAQRTGRNRRAPVDVLDRHYDEPGQIQHVLVRIMDYYFRVHIPLGPGDMRTPGRYVTVEEAMHPGEAPGNAIATPTTQLIDPAVEFLESERANDWLQVSPHLEVYVRRTSRPFDGQWYQVLDLANFRVRDPDQIGKGHFSRFMQAVVTDPRLQTWSLYVENVMGGDPSGAWKLVKWFHARPEWIEIPPPKLITGPSFWLLRPASLEGTEPSMPRW